MKCFSLHYKFNKFTQRRTIVVLSLIKLCHLHNVSLLFLNHAFANSYDVFVILLLLLPFTLKLTIVTLFYSICLLHKRIVVNLS